MSQKDTEKNKRKKKKGTGLIVVCVTLLILLFAVLIILIWQISRVGNGETVGFGGKTGNTQAVSQNTPSVTQEAALTSSSGSEANAEEVQTQAQTEAAQAESAAGQTQAAGQATMMEPQTYENDANGNMIVPERQAGSMETEPAWEYVLEKTGDSVLDDANYLAAMYDYDGAIAKIQSVSGYERATQLIQQPLQIMSRERARLLSTQITAQFLIFSSIRLLLIQAEPLMITSQSASRMV